MHVRCVANSLVSITEYQNRPIFDKVMRKTWGVYFFDSHCTLVTASFTHQ